MNAKRISLLSLALTGGLLAAGAASAQTTSTGTATSGAQAVAIAGGGGGASSLTYGGDYTVRNVPSPQSYLALPPCGSGASIGVGWAGAGFSASAGGEAEGCARRATAFALSAMGMREEAVALLQQDPNVAKAFQVAADQRKARAAQPAAGPVPPVMVDGVPFPGAVRLPDGRWARM